MKTRIFNIIVLLSFMFLYHAETYSQCLNTTSYGSATAPTSGSVTLTPCQFAGEYATIDYVVSGTTYRSSSSVATDYLTIRSGTPDGPVVAFGATPLVWTATSSGTYYQHCNSDASCGTVDTCRMTTIAIPRPCASCTPEDMALGTIGTIVYGYSVSGNLGNDGKWVGSFTGEAGIIYHFDLCPDTPGAGTNNLDIDIKITDASCNILTGADGNCSSPSYAPNDWQWTCPSNGTYYVILAPYSSYGSHNCTGTSSDTFTMEYYMSGQTQPVVCPNNVTIVENESDCYDEYTDSYNGGCNSIPNVFTELTGCNDVVCGKSGTYLFDTTNNYRDTDWYRLSLTGNTTVTLKAVADFPLQIFVLDITAGCGSLAQIASASTAAGDTAYISTTFGPGILAYWIGPSVFSGITCGSNYVMYCNTVPINAPATPVIADVPACGQTQLNGMIAPAGETYYWQGSSCDTSTANPASNPYPVTSSGMFYVRAMNDLTGCWSSCTPVDVTIYDIPVPTAYADGSASGVTVCASDSVLLTGICTAPTSDIMYRWLKGPEVISDWSADSSYMLHAPQDTLYTLETRYCLHQPEVLILYADVTDAGLTTFLSSHPEIVSVTAIDARSYTPALAELMNYDVVITWSNYLYSDAVMMGNVLKDYVDAGGKLVTLFFANDVNWGLQGNYLSQNYSPIQQGDSYSDDSTTIGTVTQPSHPIMAGVTDIIPVWHHYTSTLTAGAEEVFSWSDGYLGAAYKIFPSSGIITALNYYPAMDGGTDGDTLILNSVLWLSQNLCIQSPCISSDDVAVAINVTPAPATPGAISGTAAVCPETSQVYNITAVPNATTYTWTVPTGWTVIAGAGTTSIAVTAGSAGQNGTITVTAGNSSCEASAASSLPVTVSPEAPITPGTISGTAEVCPATSQVYNITAVPNAATYTWTVPTGWTVTAGAGTTSITVTAGSTGQNGTIDVTAGNSCGTSIASSLPVTVSPEAPITPGTISGTAEVCPATSQVYSITAVPNATTYTWTVPTGWTVIAGAGTTSIAVTAGSAGQNGTITVTAGNSCGTSTASSLPVTVSPAAPITPGTISGTADVCPATSQVYSITAVQNATTYTWTVPTGWTVTAGAGTTSITVTAGSAGQNGAITVTAGNSCGNSSASIFSVVINPLPATAGTITGTSSVCVNTIGVAYSVPVITDATSYIWAYSGTGATINGSGNAVTLDFSATATSGTLTVKGNNACGDGNPSSFSIVVDPCAMIEENPGGIMVQIYPNPNSGVFSIVFNSDVNTQYQMTIVNAIGQQLIDDVMTIQNGLNHFDIDMSAYATGTYYLNLVNHENKIVKTIMISH